jgi:hypothetical protein
MLRDGDPMNVADAVAGKARPTTAATKSERISHTLARSRGYDGSGAQSVDSPTPDPPPS